MVGGLSPAHRQNLRPVIHAIGEREIVMHRHPERQDARHGEEENGHDQAELDQRLASSPVGSGPQFRAGRFIESMRAGRFHLVGAFYVFNLYPVG